MTQRVERTAAWLYEGLWGVLTGWLRVPREPPTLPAAEGDVVESFRPAPGFLQYLKLWFWIVLTAIDVAILAGWVIVTIASPLLGAILAVPALVVAIVPDLLAYVTIHLRYDTTWYVITTRSLRIRRGIWVIHETTITFDNVQNVRLRQGPVQRRYGIAELVVRTAGGGGGGGAHGQQGTPSHVGLIEGITDAERVRDLIMARMGKSKTAGLGDEHPGEAAPRTGLTAEHVEVLREIRDLVAAGA